MASEDKATCYRTPPQIAEQLRVSVAKVLGWIRRGELRAVNVADRSTGRPRWRVSPESFASFLEARRSPDPEHAALSRSTATSHIRAVDEFYERLLAEGRFPYFFASMAEFQWWLQQSKPMRQANARGEFYLGDDGVPHRQDHCRQRGPRAVCIIPSFNRQNVPRAFARRRGTRRAVEYSHEERVLRRAKAMSQHAPHPDKYRFELFIERACERHFEETGIRVTPEAVLDLPHAEYGLTAEFKAGLSGRPQSSSPVQPDR